MDNSIKTVFQSKFFRIIQTEVEHNGKKFTKDIIERRDVVCVLALTDDDEICLVSQYRDALQKLSLEGVAGQMDPGEDPLVAAKRELQEETGLEATDWTHITTLYQSANIIGKYYIFLAKGLHQGEPSPDEDEDIQTVKMPLSEAVRKAITGEIEVSSTVGAILLLDALKKAGKI